MAATWGPKLINYNDSEHNDELDVTNVILALKIDLDCSYLSSTSNGLL